MTPAQERVEEALACAESGLCFKDERLANCPHPKRLASELRRLRTQAEGMREALEKGREVAENIVASWKGFDFTPDMIALERFAAQRGE